MASVKKFGALCGEFSDIADFVTIYISEAHPYESGDLPESYEFKIATHEQFEERIEAAQSLNRKFKPLNITSCPLLVDFMDDKANKAYGALPERLYILLNGKIAYMGGQGPMDYKINEVEDWLKKLKKRNQ